MEFFPFGPHLTQEMLTQLNPARHSPCEIQRQRHFGQLLYMIRNAHVHHTLRWENKPSRLELVSSSVTQWMVNVTSYLNYVLVSLPSVKQQPKKYVFPPH